MASYIVADRKQAQGVYPATRVRSSKGLVGELVGTTRFELATSPTPIPETTQSE